MPKCDFNKVAKQLYMVNGNILKNTALRETYSKSKLALDFVKMFGYLDFFKMLFKTKNTKHLGCSSLCKISKNTGFYCTA